MCMCAFLGTNAAHILYEVSEMLQKALGPPVPGTIVLSLSGHPLGSSQEIAKASGPANVCGPWSFVSRPSCLQAADQSSLETRA
jgi:hypothetical protein